MQDKIAEEIHKVNDFKIKDIKKECNDLKWYDVPPVDVTRVILPVRMIIDSTNKPNTWTNLKALLLNLKI